MKKTVVVTGGVGLIGFHLCLSLMNSGYKVICIDNLSTSRKGNLSVLQKNNLFRYVHCDISEKMPALSEIELIYHLACPASPIHYQKNPVKTIKTNVSGTINVLESAKKLDAGVVFTSTSEVYGNPEIHPQPENYNGNVDTGSPRSCYDEGKRCAETLCFDYKRQFGIDVSIARIFNTYGPNMADNDGRVVSNFITKALAGKDLIIHGDGTQTRSFCFVEDTVKGLKTFINHYKHFTGPVNLGSTEEISIKYLAETIIRLTNSSSEIKFSKPAPADPVRRKPDIALAEKTLSWKAAVPLEEGLVRTINWFRTANR